MIKRVVVIQNKLGMTLVEVMISMVVVSIIAMASSTYVCNAERFFCNAEKQMEALDCAEYFMALFMGSDFSSLPFVPTEDVVFDANADESHWVNQNNGEWRYSPSNDPTRVYVCSMDLAVHSDEEWYNYLEASLTVTPVDGRGGSVVLVGREELP